MDELGNRLKSLRLERDLTLDMLVLDLKEKFHIEISKANVSRWENGISEPSLHYVRYLCEYFNVSLDYIVGLTDTRTPTKLLINSRKAAGKEVQKRKNDTLEN
jgi:transcriptional regulator with XRE-family HTH domain